jgi:hypothetical protein
MGRGAILDGAGVLFKKVVMRKVEQAEAVETACIGAQEIIVA